jgi:hypothetical protein
VSLFSSRDIDRAREELATKSAEEIEWATSRAWALRALLAYGSACETLDVETLCAAVGYHAEALEHAAAASADWLAQLTPELAAARSEAVDVFEQSLFGRREERA